ncbi:MAG: mercury(II) reductase [Nitrospirota bacterium]
MRTDRSFDVVILGSGSSAFAAAIKATELGARVAMTEAGLIGGTCVNVGCIPSKTLIQAAELSYAPVHTAYRGLGVPQGRVDLAALVRQKDRLVRRLRQHKYLEVAEGNDQITRLKGRARLVSQNHVRVGDRVVKGRWMLIATGSRPCIPSIPGLETVRYLTSTDALALTTRPRSMVVIGGGFIALELGQMFHRFGTKVTIVERGPRVLKAFDDEIAESIQAILREEGLAIATQTRVNGVRRVGKHIAVDVTRHGRAKRLKAEHLLIACGRTPNSDGIGLEHAGIAVDAQGFIQVNDELRTTVESIWAAGDVTGPPLATPVGAREGVLAAENMFKGAKRTMDYTAIPRAVFTDPEVAAVGMSTAEARAQGLQVEADCLDLIHVPKAAAIYQTKGLVKMVIERGTKRIVGMQLVASRGADIIHEATLAVRHRFTIHDLIRTIHVYPTMSEAIRMAAQMFIKDVSRLSCCAE